MRGARGDGWPEWLGGATMVGVTAGPVALSFVAGDHPALGLKILVTAGMAASFLLLGLAAPLAGHRRRYVFWALLPWMGIFMAWEFGRALVRLSRGTATPALSVNIDASEIAT